LKLDFNQLFRIFAFCQKKVPAGHLHKHLKFFKNAKRKKKEKSKDCKAQAQEKTSQESP
jgi:hypothetical protein